MPRSAFPAGVTLLPEPSYERARAFVSPAALVVTLAAVEVTSSGVRLQAVLANPGDDDVSVIGFPCGDGPFFARVVPDAAIALWRSDDPARPAHLPPPRPAAPPPPIEFNVPAGAEIGFSMTIELDPFCYVGSPEIEIEWLFHYWNEPFPRARIRVRAPERPARR